MTTRQKRRSWQAVGLAAIGIVTAGWLCPSARAQAQEPPAPSGPTPDEPIPGAEAPQQPSPPPPEMAPPPAMPAPPVPAAESEARPKPAEKRQKNLETTVGMDPVQHDLGPEADLLGAVDLGVPKLRTKGWKYAMHGYFRAPVRVGIGPRTDQFPGQQWHSPARVPGYNATEWNYVGLTPNPGGSLYLNISNPNVSGNVIITTDTLNDSSYDNLAKIGGVAQAYVTMKFPEVFGNRGGLAWTVGAFSNRYGVAGPRQESTGYYGTYLFGRTHVAGEALVANIDITPHLELVVEHGFGAKLEVVPWVDPVLHSPPPPIAPYLPFQGPVPQGSTYVHHAHVSLLVDDWLQVSGHYLRSFSPNDYALVPGVPAPWASMTVYGGEVHVDGPRMGSGYLGYSHIDATALLPLAGGVEVLHGVDGLGFKLNYFEPLSVASQINIAQTPHNDTGKVDTVLFQYLVRLAPLLGRPRSGPDVGLGLFAMYNHITAPNVPASLSQDRLKFGADLTVSITHFAAAGVRFDRVLPDGPDTATAYSALSPRLIFHTKWLSREYIVVDYTRYFYGPQTLSSPPNSGFTYQQNGVSPSANYVFQTPHPDPNLIVVSALISF